MPAEAVSFEEARKQTLAYFGGREDLGIGVGVDAYCTKYALIHPETNLVHEPTPDLMHRRLAKEFARIEKKYPNPMSEEGIYELLKDFGDIIPQGSPCAGIGNPFQVVSLSNCFVIEPPQDSYGGICRADEEIAQIQKRRGGVGTDIATLRPRHSLVSNAARTSDGQVVYAERYSNTTREVAQGGRRGALMLSDSIHHPQVFDFIGMKHDRKKVTGANVSIRVSDEFMQALEADAEYEQRFPVDGPDGLPLAAGVARKISTMTSAKGVWDQIVQEAWENAEPGVLFWDTILRGCPADCYHAFGFRTRGVNPCAELHLSPYDSCRLLVINLTQFVENPFTAKAFFNYARYHYVAKVAQRLMDDLVDLELEAIDKILAKIETDPEPEKVKRVERELWQKIRHACATGRRTGTGVTGVGDMVAMLGLRYGSEEATEVVEEVYKELARGTWTASVDLAEERGAFPIWDAKLEEGHPLITRVLGLDPQLAARHAKFGRRNIAITTTAPVGTISTVALLSRALRLFGTTSGIENATFLESIRYRKLTGEEQNVVADRVDEKGDRWKRYTGRHPGLEMWRAITGKMDPKESPYFKATIEDVDWLAGVRMQAAAQKWVCHGISRTVNLPKTATKEIVDDVYRTAWKLGIKGVTVYRDGCRDGVIKKAGSEDEQTEVFPSSRAPKRPKVLEADVHFTKVQKEPWVVIVGMFAEKPYEVFAGPKAKVHEQLNRDAKTVRVEKMKKGNYALSFEYGDATHVQDNIGASLETPTEAILTRMVSTALRHGTPIQFLVEQLQKGDKSEDLYSMSRVLARVLKGYIPEGTEASGSICPACQNPGLVYKEGCMSCPSCGSGKCG